MVEDNPTDAELLLRALGKRNLASGVLVVTDGAEALDFMERNSGRLPKAIFLDLKLPKVSGLEVLRRIRNNEATKRVPIVVLTSSREESDIEASYRLGANSYVVKPVDYGKFVEAVTELGVYWLSLNETPAATPPRPAGS